MRFPSHILTSGTVCWIHQDGKTRGKIYDNEHYQQTNGNYPTIRQHVADRLAKLEKWQTHLINPHIILSKEPQGFVADATINTPNGVLVASGKHEDMYTAINELINKLERQLNKLQHKGEARRAATSVKDANFVEEVEEE